LRKHQQNPPGLARKGKRMIVFTDQRRLSLSEKDFVSAVSARLPIPKNRQDQKLLAALRALA
jgi:hypothetical protein